MEQDKKEPLTLSIKIDPFDGLLGLTSLTINFKPGQFEIATGQKSDGAIYTKTSDSEGKVIISCSASRDPHSRGRSPN